MAVTGFNMEPNWNATVKKYDGTSWLPVGSGVLTTNGADNTIIATGPNDVPYVFYIDERYAPCFCR